jgi:PASTA domain
MAVRLAALLPRAVIVVLVWMLATAAFTLAADKQIIGPSTPKTVPAAPAPPLVVPSVTGQAFVFAKGMLEDSGFAWRVEGPVHGYAANRVVGQSPAAGTKVVNTGAPTIVLHLEKGQYAQNGAPEDTASYTGTRIVIPGAARPKPATPKTVAPKPAPTAVAPKKPAVAKPAKKPAVSKARPPAFVRPGAPKEPLNEISLPARANQLVAWAATNPKATKKNVGHWLYQHAWIVDGARFGWWHGAQALTTLVAVDRKLQRLWGIGHRSEAVARAALKRVKREAK